MSNEKFNNACNRIAQPCPPIWMMRQAGRYQKSYMELKEKYTFEQMCKLPQLAMQTAMLPIEEFDFDAAILFSDILWHLEGLGFPVEFAPGPKFTEHLTEENYSKFSDVDSAVLHLEFQKKAIISTKEKLSSKKSLIGFVGGPWSLLNYALGPNKVSRDFKTMYLKDVIVPLIKESIREQKRAGADVVMILDSGLDNVSKRYYDSIYIEFLKEIALIGNVGYYVRGISETSLSKLKKLDFAGLGIDSSHNLPKMLNTYSKGFVQGNFNEQFLLLETKLFNYELDKWLDTLSDVDTTGWICGLGHGITKTTPTEHIHHFVKTVRSHFSS